MKNVVILAVLLAAFAACKSLKIKEILNELPQITVDTQTVSVPIRLDTVYLVKTDTLFAFFSIPEQWADTSAVGAYWDWSSDSVAVRVEKTPGAFRVVTKYLPRTVEVPVHIRDTVTVEVPIRVDVGEALEKAGSRSYWWALLVFALGAGAEYLRRKLLRNGNKSDNHV